MGKDALISILSKYIHPSALIRKHWPNPMTGHRLNCKVIRQEMKILSRKKQLVVVFSSAEVTDHKGNQLELHATPHWCKMIEEGPEDYFSVQRL